MALRKEVRQIKPERAILAKTTASDAVTVASCKRIAALMRASGVAGVSRRRSYLHDDQALPARIGQRPIGSNASLSPQTSMRIGCYPPFTWRSSHASLNL
jgi:hypothetical protein